MKSSNLEKYTSEQLRACQLRQLEILCYVDTICKKHGLRYWLDGGTLLGAVRHKGFIPWDDDLDIAMPLEDMNKFIQIAPKELPADLFLQTKTTDPSFPFPFTKIRDTNSFYVGFTDDFRKEYQKGIFGFIAYPSLPKKWVKFITKRISKSYSILHALHHYSIRASAELFWFSAMYISLKAIWNILSLFYSKKEYISCELINNGYGMMHRTDIVYPLSTITFEGKEFNAPANPDIYLTNQYNDYMTLPPLEERRVHGIYINPCLNEEQQ